RCPDRPLPALGGRPRLVGVRFPISKPVPNRSAPSGGSGKTAETLVDAGLYGYAGQAMPSRSAARRRRIPGNSFLFAPWFVEYLPEFGPQWTFGAGLGPRPWPRLPS